jgi:hypothetical protein
VPTRPPEITLSPDDRRLLDLLARLIVSDSRDQANYRLGQEIVLSDAEAQELILLLEEFASSPRFVDGSYFVEKLFGSPGSSDVDEREIYLKWRKRNGRSRALASTHWREFLVRLGLSKDRGGYFAGGPVIQARRMDLHRFLELEKRLLEHSNLSPRVRTLILRLVAAQSNALETIRRGDALLRKGSATKLPKQISQELSDARRSSVGVKPMSANKIAGVMTVVIDMSALFTTRDWNVVGTMSTVAGALVAASE